MTHTAEDTIYALASGSFPSAIAIIRLSGTQCTNIITSLADDSIVNNPKQAKVKWLKDADGDVIDQAIIVYFPAPNSYTGEDYAELHHHGSPAIMKKITNRLNELQCRMALPGEFTKRSFLSGKMDLTQAEAINDLILAETNAQHELALKQMQGALGSYYQTMKTRLITLLAHMEAMIDFTEDEDFGDIMKQQQQNIQLLHQEITAHLDDNHIGELIRKGIKVALIGAPNTGKSTLLNHLAKRDIAITTPIAGTTRDILEVSINIGGYAVILSDSAGIRQSDDLIEQEGIRRSEILAKHADIIINVAAMNEAGGIDKIDIENADIQLLNKIDLEPSKSLQKTDDYIAISLLRDQNIQNFLDRLTLLIQEKMTHTRTSPYITHHRYRDILFHVKHHMETCIELYETEPDKIELIAENLRHCATLMGKLTGHIDVESLLDIIFKDFCIGK